ncbi:hypothetical protein, partial [Candidatus Cryosericum odellii]
MICSLFDRKVENRSSLLILPPQDFGWQMNATNTLYKYTGFTTALNWSHMRMSPAAGATGDREA